jgi:hypothetical protein
VELNDVAHAVLKIFERAADMPGDMAVLLLALAIILLTLTND